MHIQWIPGLLSLLRRPGDEARLISIVRGLAAAFKSRFWSQIHVKHSYADQQGCTRQLADLFDSNAIHDDSQCIMASKGSWGGGDLHPPGQLEVTLTIIIVIDLSMDIQHLHKNVHVHTTILGFLGCAKPTRMQNDVIPEQANVKVATLEDNSLGMSPA